MSLSSHVSLFTHLSLHSLSPVNSLFPFSMTLTMITISVRTALTNPDFQSVWALVHSLGGEVLASRRKNKSRYSVQTSNHLEWRGMENRVPLAFTCVVASTCMCCAVLCCAVPCRAAAAAAAAAVCRVVSCRVVSCRVVSCCCCLSVVVC